MSIDFKPFDYGSYQENLDSYVDKIDRLRSVGEQDSAIELLFNFARFMVAWGDKELLKGLLDSFDDSVINHKNRLYKRFYLFFEQIIPYYNPELNLEKTKADLAELSGLSHEYTELYLEIRNLNGIFSRLYMKDKDQAIAIHENSLKVAVGQRTQILDVLAARSLLNLSLCYRDKQDQTEALSLWNRAYEIVKELDNPYFKCKMYIIKAGILFNKDTEKEKLDLAEMVSTFRMIDEITFEYDFPDLERIYHNLLGDVSLKLNKDYSGYFVQKGNVFYCDEVLYFENFNQDFVHMLQDIKDCLEDKDEFVDDLDHIIECLDELQLEDEAVFIEGVKNFLRETPQKDIMIKNEQLQKIYEGYISALEG